MIKCLVRATLVLLVFAGPFAGAAESTPAAVPSIPTPLLGTAGPAVIKAKSSYSEVNVDGPYIAITFDDGPRAKNTSKLLDLLAAKHIKGTFFILGECAETNPEIVKRIAAEGHEIANHTWTHLNFAKSSDEAIRGELQRAEKKIVELTGTKPKLTRPPYGAMSARQRQWVRDEFGYNIVLWDVDPLDWKEPGISVVVKRIADETRAGSIILTHDIHAPTVEAMPEILDTLLAKGFKFVTVSELIAMDKGGARPPLKKAEPAAPAAKQPGTTAPDASPKSKPATETKPQ